MFDLFYENVVLSKSLASFSIALISKVVSPLEFRGFRIISFIWSLYKLVSKVFEVKLVG